MDFDHDRLVSLLEARSSALGQPSFAGPFSRDRVAEYCARNQIEWVNERYPSPLVGRGVPTDDDGEAHNALFVEAFAAELAAAGDSTMLLYFDAFDEPPHARGFRVAPTACLARADELELPIRFIDDVWFLAHDLRYALCLFHHDAVEIFGFGASATDLLARMARRLRRPATIDIFEPVS